MTAVQRSVEEHLCDTLAAPTLGKAQAAVVEWIAMKGVEGWETTGVEYLDHRHVRNPTRPEEIEVKLVARRSRTVEVRP